MAALNAWNMDYEAILRQMLSTGREAPPDSPAYTPTIYSNGNQMPRTRKGKGKQVGADYREVIVAKTNRQTRPTMKCMCQTPRLQLHEEKATIHLFAVVASRKALGVTASIARRSACLACLKGGCLMIIAPTLHFIEGKAAMPTTLSTTRHGLGSFANS